MDISIGELSRQTGVKVPTIRYYEQIGLVELPSRTEGKQRRYLASHVARLNFIRHARELGFAVEDIRSLLALSSQRDQSCSEVDRIARQHLSNLDQRIGHLQALQGELRLMIEQCSHGCVDECRVIEVLADHRECELDHRGA